MFSAYQLDTLARSYTTFHEKLTEFKVGVACIKNIEQGIEKCDVATKLLRRYKKQLKNGDIAKEVGVRISFRVM